MMGIGAEFCGLKRRARRPLAAAACVPLLPIFIVRLSLAYFPALVGHALDALVLWYLLARVRGFDRPRVVLASLMVLTGSALVQWREKRKAAAANGRHAAA